MLLLCSFFRLKELFPVKNGFKLRCFFKNFFWKCQNLEDANASVNSSCAHTPPPRATAGICSPCQCRGWGICKFCTARGRAFANPGAISELFTCTQFPISFLSEYNYSEGFIGSPVKDRNKLKRVVKVWSQFFACISSLHIKMELHSKNRSYRCESTCFGYWIKFEEHPFIFIKLFATYNVTVLY